MSQTTYINFRGNGFWAYDVVSSVFLRFMINAAIERTAANTDEWLNDTLENWRVNAVTPDLGFYLDDDWPHTKIATVVELCQRAAETIRIGGDISASDVESWPILDELRIFPRGYDPVPAEPVARFGDAVVALLENTLPKPPGRHAWFFTLGENVGTIALHAGG
jgi:hypothetical protein